MSTAIDDWDLPTALNYIRSQRKKYNETVEKWTFAVDVHTVISDSPLSILTEEEVEALLSNWYGY